MRRKLEKKMTMCSALIGDHEGMNRYIRCDPIYYSLLDSGALPSAALGKEQSAKNPSAKVSLPSVKGPNG